MKMAHRPNTRRNKRSQAEIYQRFCEDNNLVELPADEWQMCRYAVYTAERVTSHATVKNYVGGVRNLQEMAGYQVVPPTSPNFKTIMQGLKTYLAKPTKQALPMTTEILVDISQLVKMDNQFELCAFAATLTGFYMVLRCSNLVPTSTSTFNPNEQFMRWHVGIDEDNKLAMFLIEWSKTIQHCQKEMWVPAMPSTDDSICLIKVMKRYLQLVPACDVDPCFCYRNKKGRLLALTYEQMTAQIKDWVTATGREGDLYTGHCLRRGGTSHTFEMGIRPEYIRMMGDWASQCFYRYLDISLQHRIKAAVKFAK